MTGSVFSFNTVGFCDGSSTWEDCRPFGIGDISINDDELYRKFLKVRRFQMLSLYDLDSLTAAIQILWGPTAVVLSARNRRVVVAPGRDLTAAERNFIQLYPRVLPIAPGIAVRFQFGSTTRVFGFGEGWGGFCEEIVSEGEPLTNEFGVPLTTDDDEPILVGAATVRSAPWMCAVDVHPYSCE